MSARPHQRYQYPATAEVPVATGVVKKSRRPAHFNIMELPGPSTVGAKRPRDPSPARPVEPNKLMRYTDEGQAYNDGSVLPEGLTYREAQTDEQLPWYKNPFHKKFIKP